MLRYALAWIPMLGLAVANGALRQLLFARLMPELRAHQLSTLTGSMVLGGWIWFVLRTWPLSSTRQALLVGGLWLTLTVAFECFMGLVLAGRPLSEVLLDYDVRAGRVWVFFLIWLTLAPLLFHKLESAA